jgi:Sulfotransferase domain
MFHFGVARGKFRSDESLDELVQAFVRGAVCGKLIRPQVRSWAENVMSWVSQVDQGNPSVLLLRYEDLKAGTVGELRRVVNFLRLPVDDSVLRAAVENSSFERLQEFEEEFDKVYSRKDWVAGSRFIRKGAVDEWKEILSPAQNEMICAAFEPAMERMGYG